MSLPPSQRRTLEAIECRLRIREPRLVSMFAIFTRLTEDEAVPHTETIQVSRWDVAGRVTGWRRAATRRRALKASRRSQSLLTRNTSAPRFTS